MNKLFLTITLMFVFIVSGMSQDLLSTPKAIEVIEEHLQEADLMNTATRVAPLNSISADKAKQITLIAYRKSLNTEDNSLELVEDVLTKLESKNIFSQTNKSSMRDYLLPIISE